ncbi:MAG: 50S ribosomal protein L28 [Buchnera aphidicola (Nurudea yanoniella)]
MSKICKITRKKPMIGNRRSHAMNATKRRFFPNLQRHRFWDIQNNRFISLKISAKGIRYIDKLGSDIIFKKKLLPKNKST